MIHFFSMIQGSSSAATRCGTKKSGIESHTHGWLSGAKVRCFVDENDHDVVEVYATHGSGNHNFKGKAIGLVFRSVNGKIDFISSIQLLTDLKYRYI